MSKPIRHSEVISALIGGTEKDVVTLITRPMWQLFCRAVNEPEDSEPRFSGNVLLVYGSQTIVVESDRMVSISFARKDGE